MLKKNKFLFLFLISFAIILSVVIEARLNPARAMKGNYPSNLFRALQIQNTTAENYLLSPQPPLLIHIYIHDKRPG